MNKETVGGFNAAMKQFIYRLIRRRQESLKRRTDRRFEGIWMGPAPRLLGFEELRVGDVLFCGQANQDKVTELIQNTTDGVYVHCGIYLGSRNVVDFVKSGAREIQLDKFIADYAYVAVTRSPGMNQQREDMIAKFARRCVNTRLSYNFIGSLLVPWREYLNIRKYNSIKPSRRLTRIRRRYQPKPKAYFCSEFILQCFLRCNYIEHRDRYYQPAKWSPTGLAEENIFELIGFMSIGGLAAVDPADPHLGGCGWVLTPEGQSRLKSTREKMDAKLDALRLKLDADEGKNKQAAVIKNRLKE